MRRVHRQMHTPLVWLALSAWLGPSGSVHAAPPAAPLVTQQRFDSKALPRAIPDRGQVLAGLRWRDVKGDNLLILSVRAAEQPSRHSPGERVQARYLHARHLLLSADGKRARLVREVKDLVERCEFDVQAEFIDRSLSVTDLDRDGVGEATFAYRLGCRSDVSPNTLKLLLLEGGAKHILRGETLVPVSETETQGGGFKIDPSFRRAPPAFLDHARQTWKRIAREF